MEMPKKILILEDDADIRELLKVTLSQSGYDVEEAHSVPKAVTIMRKGDVNLCIVDIMMPMVDGYKFCEWVRQRSEFSATPIVIVTGHEKRYGREKAEELCIDAFFTKPCDMVQLKRKVNELLTPGKHHPAS